MKQKLKKLKLSAQKETIRYKVLSDALKEENPIEYLKEVQNYGCKNGAVPSLIYYDDTHKFFDKYYKEINELKQNYEEEIGQLKIEYDLKNFLAWFSYEVVVNDILDEIGAE